MKSFGERLPACETEAFHTQAKGCIPASLQPALTPVLATLTQVHEQIRACDKLQLGSRGGKSAKRRARVAVARKLAVLMHRLWVTGEQYEPVGYKPKRAAA